jgi:hypothetical protein
MLYAAHDAMSAPARRGAIQRVRGAQARLALGPPSASLVLLAAASLVLAVVLGIQIVGARGTASPPATGPLQTNTGALPSQLHTPGLPPSPTPSDASTQSPPPSQSALASSTDGLLAPLPACFDYRCPVPAGTYRALEFRLMPKLVLDSGWSAETFGEGYLALALNDRPQSLLQLLWMSTLPGDPCALTEGQSGLDQSAFLGWLRSQKALKVGSDVLRRFPHVNAVQVDLTVNADQACQYGSPPYVVIQSQSSESMSGFQLQAGSTIRAYVFDHGSDLVMAIVEAPTPDEFALLLPKAEAVLASLDFDQ